MARARTEYVCQQCGARSTKWMGRCADCGEWNSLIEQIERNASKTRPTAAGAAPKPVRLRDVQDASADRLILSLNEVNRVLGGGIVRGSLVLLGGDPGIGKSTLLTQVCNAVAASHGPVLYVSGEESPSQVAMRARRLDLAADDLMFLGETDLPTILQAAEGLRPCLMVVDSIQSTAMPELESSPGSVSQLRECAHQLMRFAKDRGIAVFMIGHVTKEGAIAGPKVLEHMVDTVLYLEGERFQAYRLLRSTKNRFGPTNEVGVLEMQGDGLVEVANPSAAFLSERDPSSPGSAVVVTMEGTRPLLVEIQALVTRTGLAVPRRTGNGMDFNRLLLLTAVLSRRLGLPLHDQDIYVNVVGGIRIEEPAADLAAALAIMSSLRDRPLEPGTVVAGEVGLSGELRSVSQLGQRLREAVNLGFRRAIVPRGAGPSESTQTELEMVYAGSLREAAHAAML